MKGNTPDVYQVEAERVLVTFGVADRVYFVAADVKLVSSVLPFRAFAWKLYCVFAVRPDLGHEFVCVQPEFVAVTDSWKYRPDDPLDRFVRVPLAETAMLVVPTVPKIIPVGVSIDAYADASGPSVFP